MKRPRCTGEDALRLLTPEEAANTLLHRLTPTIDRLRQRYVNFGLRSYQVFLVWVRWSGGARGEGVEEVIARRPILPIPEVTDLTAMSLQAFAVGIIPSGSVRVNGISARYSQDELAGLTIPPDKKETFARKLTGKRTTAEDDAFAQESVVQAYEFFWEVVDDGRSGGRAPKRARFRPFSEAFRKPGDMEWQIILERQSSEMGRDGQPR